MSENKNILKKSRNYFRAVGTLYETNLKKEPCDIKLKDEDGKEAGTAKGERITGKVSVRTDSGIFTFDTYLQSLDNKGETNKRWAMGEAMFDWNPEVDGNGTEPTKIALGGSVAINDYVGQDNKVKSALRWSFTSASHKVSADEGSGCSLSGTFFIKSIVRETKGEEGEETGRLVVELLAVQNGGKICPIKAFVNADMADDFESGYEAGQTVPFDLDMTSRHIGGKTSGKKTFGKASTVNVSSGFDVTELIIVGGDDPIEETEEEDEDGNIIDNGYLDPKSIKAALKERQIMLTELENNPPKTKAKTAKSATDAVKEAKKKFTPTNKNTEFEEEADDDLPF